jgi:hypothetical protein
MAQSWLNRHLKFKPEVTKIFEDLESYQQFCRDYGYVFDESHLYNEVVGKNSTPYQEYLRLQRGRTPWDQWRSPRRDRA